MVTAQPLDSLGSLDRSLLHVFVIGPGKGEAIVIALPERGWLVIDGATSPLRRPSVIELIERWRVDSNDPVELLVLSHPHDDHIDGFPEVVEKLCPERIALAGTAESPRYIDLFGFAPLPTDQDRATAARKVRSAFAAMHSWERSHDRRVELVHRSTEPLLHRNALQLDVLGPAPEPLTTYLVECASKPRYLRADANRYSLVLRLRFGATTLLLPGDLPHTVGGRAVSPGWQELVSSHADLHQHSMMKIAHHGSTEAFHEQVVCEGPKRCWVVTPYNSSRLPRTTPSEGLAYLLECQRPIYLTALSVAKEAQIQHPPGEIRLTALAAQQRCPPNPFGSIALELTPTPAREPLDCVWCFALDATDTLRGLYRGKAALEVVP